MEDEENKVTSRGFFKNGLLSGIGVVEDKKKKITKRGNFKEGKLFGLGEVKEGSNMLIRGQFGPAGEVKHDWSKCKYVTAEGELLQGTAFIKEGDVYRHGKFLEPGVFLHLEQGSKARVQTFEGCFNQGKSSGLCHVVSQDGQ